jgi:hypothetical protein
MLLTFVISLSMIDLYTDYRLGKIMFAPTDTQPT